MKEDLENISKQGKQNQQFQKVQVVLERNDTHLRVHLHVASLQFAKTTMRSKIDVFSGA